MKGFDLYVEEARAREKAVERLWDILRRIKEEVLRRLPEAKVYLFGSYARGEATALSDVDLLIVADELDREERARLKAMLLSMFPELPLEIHVASRRELEAWYRRFLKPGELVEV